MAKAQPLHCSFCGRNREDVKILIAGQDGHICENCVEHAMEIIGQELTPATDEKPTTSNYKLTIRKPIEIKKFFPDCNVYQQACPMWVPLVENKEFDNPGADYFIKKDIQQLLAQSNQIDTLLLACTHYPLLINSLKKFVPPSTAIIAQGDIVAESLADYLYRHPAIENSCSKTGRLQFNTTDNTVDFNEKAAFFYGQPVQSEYVTL